MTDIQKSNLTQNNAQNSVKNDAQNSIKNDAQNSVKNDQINTQANNDSWSYITYAMVIVVIVVIIYYAYTRFMSNAEEETCDEPEQKQETGGNVVANFDLDSIIKQLENKQAEVLKSVSQKANLSVSELIINDTPTRNNKELLDFLSNNLDTIVLRGHTKLRFTLAKSSDMSALRDRGFTKFPVLYDDKANCIGSAIIVDELKKRVRVSKKPVTAKNESEVLEEFMRNEAFKGVERNSEGRFEVKGDIDDDPNTQLEKQVSEETERRKKNGKNVYGANKQAKNNDLDVKGPRRDQTEDIRANFRDRGRPDNVSPSKKQNKAPLTGDDLMVQQMLEKIGNDA
jgi:hypothetical protein